MSRFFNYIVICILPAISMVMFFSFFGIYQVIKNSFGISSGMENITLSYYRMLFASGEFWQSFFFSLRVALIASSLAVTLGAFLAFTVKKASLKYTQILWDLFIVMSYVAAAIAVYHTFSDRGFLARILHLTGIYSGSLNLVYSNNGIGVILLYVLKGTPFIVISISEIINKIDTRYRKVSENLGVPVFPYFIHIVLPLAKRALFSAWIILFNFILFSYEGFFFLGVSTPKSLGELSLIFYSSPDFERSTVSMALSTCMIVGSTALTLVYYKIMKKQTEQGL